MIFNTGRMDPNRGFAGDKLIEKSKDWAGSESSLRLDFESSNDPVLSANSAARSPRPLIPVS